jgi:hypothetical protein
MMRLHNERNAETPGGQRIGARRVVGSHDHASRAATARTAADAARWRWYRDTVLAHSKRGDLPDILCQVFATDDVKYPDAAALDAAVDACRETR